jgi:hypothetical protein
MPRVSPLDAAVAFPPLGRCGTRTALHDEFAARLAATNASGAVLMGRVRSAAVYLSTDHRYSIIGLAKCAGLHKNTAITRAEHRVILVGDGVILEKAIHTPPCISQQRCGLRGLVDANNIMQISNKDRASTHAA